MASLVMYPATSEGGVEDPSGPLCVPGLPCARSLHHARPAAGAVRVKHVWQEIPERVVVVDRFERLGRLTVGELDDGVGKSAGGTQAPEKPRLGIAQGCIRGKRSDAAADNAHTYEIPRRLKGWCLGCGERFFAPSAGQQARPCGAHGFVVAEGAPHGLHGRSHVDGIRLGGGNQGGAGRRNGPARLGDPPRKRGGHGASPPRLRGNSGLRASR